MISKTFGILFMILSLVMITVGPAFAATTQSQLTVGPFCGFSLGVAMDYLTVTPYEVSDEAVLIITGTGNAPSAATVYGTNWVGPLNNVIVNGDNTAFSFGQNGDIGLKQSISIDPANPTELTVTQNLALGPNNVYWQVDVQILNPEFGGIITQDLVFDGGCAIP